MTNKVPLTLKRIAEMCAAEGQQVFLWDSKTAGLGVRLKGNGKPAFIFQGLFAGKTLRMTIGGCSTRTLPEAAERARQLQILIDDGRDPREVKAEVQAKDLAKRKVAEKDLIKVSDIWPLYFATNGKPRKVNGWSESYKEDLQEMVDPGGRPYKRGKGTTLPGPLAELMAMPLRQMTAKAIRDWYLKEQKRGESQATRALSMFSGFLDWATGQDEYEDILPANAARHKKVQAVVSPPAPHRTNALQKGQLKAWFSSVDKLENKTMGAYLKALLLTGARKESLAELKWSDVDFRWRAISIHDKSSKTKARRREIPLLPYTESILRSLPRVEGNENVFVSNRGEGKHIVDARTAMAEVLEREGIRHCTMHDLRRSYSKFGESAKVANGATRQMMGHAPNTIGQKYTLLEVDDLRDLVEVTERYIVKWAGVDFEFDG